MKSCTECEKYLICFTLCKEVKKWINENTRKSKNKTDKHGDMDKFYLQAHGKYGWWIDEYTNT
jgi:hypothetical protein